MKTLGQFYREKVLGRKDLTQRSLPANIGEVSVVQELFGWRLQVNGKAVPCRSEEEARFLRVFVDAGLTEVEVPDDDAYLRTILPELEQLKSKIDTIVNSYLDTIRDTRTRERLRHEVYAELLV
jgi:hypothetical protein